jgi:hypothetical protein
MGGGKEKRKKKKIIIIIMIELAQLWDGKGGKRAIKCEKEVIEKFYIYNTTTPLLLPLFRT